MNISDFGKKRSRSKSSSPRRTGWSDREAIYCPVQWRVARQGVFQECTVTHRRLTPGAYTCEESAEGIKILAKPLQVDDLICVPGGLASEVLRELERFWSAGEVYQSRGFLHRRGFLLYGPHGLGKSSLIHQIVQQAIAAGNVAFFCQYPPTFLKTMALFRKIEPDRPVVCVFEDIDAIIEDHGDAEILQWLDGVHQVNNVVNLATTNYPEELDRRLVSRPRRFDRIIKIDQTPTEARQAFFARKLGDLPDGELARWVAATEGLSIAGLADLVISVMCLGQPFEDVLRKLRAMEECHPSSREYHTDSLGFINGRTNGQPVKTPE